MIVARARRAPLDVGSVFKRLTVIALAPRSADGRRRVVCRCACGTVKTIHEGCLREGSTHSCGCRSREAGARNRTHNMSKTPIYKVWSSMLQRCYDENRKDYPRYGGRGVTVCTRWWAFENFFADMGHRPDGMSLNRNDNDAEYSPENCEWSTLIEQARNTTLTHYLEFGGRRLCVAAWAEELGMSQISLQARLRRGWSVERSLSTPIDTRFSRAR